MGKKIDYPRINKKIQDFMYEEEGNISRDKVLFIGSMLIILAAMVPSKVFAAHRSHSSHSSHSSHTSSARGGGHVSHESHESHQSHVSSSTGTGHSSSNVNNQTLNNSDSATVDSSSVDIAATIKTPQIPDPTPSLE